jgi:hypothetical protein
MIIIFILFLLDYLFHFVLYFLILLFFIHLAYFFIQMNWQFDGKNS